MKRFRVMSDTGLILTVTADRYSIKHEKYYDTIEFFTSDLFEESGYACVCSLTFDAQYWVTELKPSPKFV